MSDNAIAKAIEYMIIDAILAAEPYMKIAEQIEDPKKYMFLTDDIKLRIQANPAPVSISPALNLGHTEAPHVL